MKNYLLFLFLFLTLTNISFSQGTELSFYMTTNSDDFMYYNGTTNHTVSRFGETSNIYRGIEQIYKNVTIPQNAEIISAKLVVKAKVSNSQNVVSDIYTDLRDDPSSVMSYSQFSANTNFSSVTYQYSAPAYTAGNFYQIDITNLIQDRLNQSDWTNGDNLGVIIKGNTSLTVGAFREITRAENSLTDNKLIITYQTNANITLTSQAEVDSFNLTVVTGDLRIDDEIDGDIINLDGLSELLAVGGNLFISNNFSLINLNGLSNLNSVGGYFHIYNNISLTNINGLSNLSSIVGGLNIEANISLTNIDGFANLKSFSGELNIDQNDSLINIDGLSNLTSLLLLQITHNGSLTNLDGLSNLSFVETSFSIYNNDVLINIDGLSNLSSVDDLIIGNNDALSNIDGISNLSYVGDFLGIDFNISLTNINGLSNLSYVGSSLTIDNNTALTEFCGLYNLILDNGLGGTYNVYSNSANPTQQDIIDGGPCSSGTTATYYMDTNGSDFMFYNGTTNHVVSRFGETSNLFRGIEQIYSNVTVPASAEITSAILEVKANVNNSTTVVADIYADLRDDPSSVMSYSDYSGNINFSSVTYQYSAPGFTAGNFYQIDITDIIQDKVNQANWTEGDNLGIIIKGNPGLTAGSFREITRAENSLIDNKLIITYNSTLPKIAGKELVEYIPENYELFQNYPNPFNPTTTIEYQIPQEGLVTLTVYDVLGNEIKTLVNEPKSTGRYIMSFDASELSSGIYIYRVKVNDFISTKKMILLK